MELNKKYFWFDVETTGVDPKEHDIIELSFIIVNGPVTDERQIFMQPFSYDNISPTALEVNNRTIEEIKTFPEPGQAYKDLIKILSAHVDKFDKADKFKPCGHNAKFDTDFLRQFFIKNFDKYYGSWFRNEFLCSMAMAMLLDELDYISPDDFKLATLAKVYGIDTGVEHEGMSDIRTTRTLFRAMVKQLQCGRIGGE
jgi:DNA polymerase III alpha subunit (gram-positive type)